MVVRRCASAFIVMYWVLLSLLSFIVVLLGRDVLLHQASVGHAICASFLLVISFRGWVLARNFVL